MMSATSQKASARLETRGPITVAGIARTYPCDGPNDIPAQWQALGPHISEFVDGCGAFGVCSGVASDGSTYRYLAGVPVKSTRDLPRDFTSEVIPARTYAIFTHRGSAAGIPEAVQRIFREDLPRLGLLPDGEPGLIESYDERFDPRTGSGEVDLWVPVKS